MRVVILIDNNPDPEGEFLTEHGLSIYFEADGLKWLFDVGASPNFAFNAKKLGIKIQDVDFLILSHAHRDHTGGLEHFLRKNHKAKVFMAPVNRGHLFVSYRKQIDHDITIDYSLINAFANRFSFADQNIQLSDNVTLIRNIEKTHPLPKANSLLFQAAGSLKRADDFSHEIVLAVKTAEGIVLFSGCSHHGILNILDGVSRVYGDQKLIAAIGGTHLLDSDDYSQFETTPEIKNLIHEIVRRFPVMRLITGHCTGKQAQKLFSTELAGRFNLFNSGASYEFR